MSIEDYKEQIPEFIVKLYHILKKKEYQDFICWAADGSEVLIKNSKKVEEKVLPHYFRHKRLSSFIRQMNMYNFAKINKLSKERNYLYFKNDLFTSENIEGMRRINRKNGRRGGGPKPKNNEDRKCEQEGRERKVQSQKSAIAFNKIQQILTEIAKDCPEVIEELQPALQICQAMGRRRSPEQMEQNALALGTISHFLLDQAENQRSSNLKGMIEVSMKDIAPGFQSLAIPSLCSFSNLQ